MSNMSYCRFQNTLSDLQDCYEALGEIMDVDNSGLSEDEEKALKRLIKLCTKIANDWEGAV